MLGGFLSRLFRSRRVALAVLGNGTVSLASLALSVSIARSSSVAGFGAFSLAMVAYMFASGLVRSALTDSAVSRPEDPETYARSFQRAGVVALLCAGVLIVWGLLSENGYLVVLGASLHGQVALDFIRAFDSAAGDARRAAVATAAWSAPTLVTAVLSLSVPIDPLLIFVVWAAGGAVCGYVLLVRTAAPFIPRWPRNPEDTKVAATFAMDYMVGSGGSLLTTGLLGLLDNTRVLGAVRGAGTLLGPLNLLSTTARSLMLPLLGRRREDPDEQLRTAIGAAAAQTLVLAPLFVALQFIPDSWGEQLLGDTWALASLALLPMGVDSIFALISAVASSGHRVAFAATRSLLLRLAVGVPRPVVVLFCGYTWGVAGAAWSMAVVSMVNAVIWWISYVDLTRRASRPPTE